MRTQRPVVTFVILAAWLMLAAAPFCQAAADPMPCCKKAGPCSEGLQAPGCCRVEPGKTVPGPAGESLPTGRTQAHAPVPAVAPEASTATPLPSNQVGWVTRPPAESSPVPLYLLNASILR